MKRKNQINWRKIATTAFVLCIVLGSFGIVAAQPSASVTPPSQQVNAGDQFTIDIDVNPGTYGVSAGELRFMFDASVLQVDDVVFGDLMAAPSTIAKVIDNTAGMVLFAVYNMGAPPVPTAPGTFATITITVDASAPIGTYDLDITSMGLADENSAVIPGITITDGTVTVAELAQITVAVDIKPETLNLASMGVFTAFIQLPEGYSIADIDVNTVECEGAPAVKGMIAGDTFIAKFNRHDLKDVMHGDEVELTVTGELFDGTLFEGSDMIRVIEKGGNK